MSTYANGIRIQTAVGGNRTSNGTSTLYTCPANSYAVVNLHVSLFGATNIDVQVSCGGQKVYWLSGNSTSYLESGPRQVYVGPGQAIVVLIQSLTGTGGFYISGVEFKNGG